MIDNEIENALSGLASGIKLKLNAITNFAMIEKLYEASNAGVSIKMIVRGICCLIPGVKGMSENIEVISFEDKNLYCFKSSNTLFQKFYSGDLYKGLTATCNGFYAFQGRETRIPLASTIDIDDLKSIKFKKYHITNLEMETAIIYGLSDFLGHNAISLNAILANRINDLYSQNPAEVVESLILFVLDRI